MGLLSSDTMSAPSVYITHPPLSLLKIPPTADPQALSPPRADYTFARPFNIDEEFYNNSLHFAVPVTFALVYATTVTLINRINKQRDHKPWGFSKSTAFYAFVLLHNFSLAIYSGWTFIGMLNAIRHSWPGWDGENGFAGVVDTLCKMHGPRGLGSAATFNPTTSGWGFSDKTLKLADNLPDTSDVGRIWNEGLAFYGWLFYLSKFYEVFDTMIVLVKGKKSSVLQTYHHAGAMMSLWAGIRYMSPPIWMFVFVNSGLHTLMYIYYSLLTLSIPVPHAMKRTLTTLQMAQIVFGASYAVAHLFIAYSIPVSVPYLFVHNLSSAIPSAAASVSSALTSATVTAGIGSWLKKVALRAAGEEGLAENVRNRQGETFGIDAVHAAEVEKAQEEIRYRTQYQTVNCIDTSGEAFAILLNVLYLAPLFLMFLNFFISTYIRGTRAPPPKPTQRQLIRDSGKEATKNVQKELHEAMDDEQGAEGTEIPEDVKARFNKAKGNAQKGAEDLSAQAKKTMKNVNDAVKDKVSNAKAQTKKQKAKADQAQVQAQGQQQRGNVEQNRQKHEQDGEVKQSSGKKDGDTSASRGAVDEDMSASKDEGDEGMSEGDGMDESAYEVNPDELKDEEEKKAEETMQPDQA